VRRVDVAESRDQPWERVPIPPLFNGRNPVGGEVKAAQRRTLDRALANVRSKDMTMRAGSFFPATRRPTAAWRENRDAPPFEWRRRIGRVCEIG